MICIFGIQYNVYKCMYSSFLRADRAPGTQNMFVIQQETRRWCGLHWKKHEGCWTMYRIPTVASEWSIAQTKGLSHGTPGPWRTHIGGQKGLTRAPHILSSLTLSTSGTPHMEKCCWADVATQGVMHVTTEASRSSALASCVLWSWLPQAPRR